jgi:hypothetical protein
VSGDRLCPRSDHPARRHWHYGPAGRYWCTDYGSPLLWQNDETPGPAYSKPTTEAVSDDRPDRRARRLAMPRLKR